MKRLPKHKLGALNLPCCGSSDPTASNLSLACLGCRLEHFAWQPLQTTEPSFPQPTSPAWTKSISLLNCCRYDSLAQPGHHLQAQHVAYHIVSQSHRVSHLLTAWVGRSCRCLGMIAVVAMVALVAVVAVVAEFDKPRACCRDFLERCKRSKRSGSST